MTDIALPLFVCRPTGTPPWPGVIVIHEGGGITPQLLRFSERLAEEGFATCAPDLYFRTGGPESTDYRTMAIAVTPDQLRGDLETCIGALRATGASAIGITGFCFGGGVSYQGALAGLGLRASVPFYGSAIPGLLGTPACPTLMLFGGTDEYIPREKIAAVEAHHGDQVIVYEDAGHGFMRDGSDSYHEAAATDAWKRMLAFFDEHLR